MEALTRGVGGRKGLRVQPRGLVNPGNLCFMNATLQVQSGPLWYANCSQQRDDQQLLVDPVAITANSPITCSCSDRHYAGSLVAVLLSRGDPREGRPSSGSPA